MAHNRSQGKLQAHGDMPMMESDDSNEDGFVSAAEELDQCIDEVCHSMNALRPLH